MKQNAAAPLSFAQRVAHWFITPEEEQGQAPAELSDRIDWFRSIPFLAIHVACLAVFLVGWSPLAVAVAASLYFLRMFAITAFYHRYFSHRSYRTSRICQFIFAVLGCSAVQRGPLWWAANHRQHHAHSDEEADLHSPVRRGFWWSHMGWFMSLRALPTNARFIPDLMKYPELRFLNRFEALVPFLLGLGLYVFGAILAAYAPEWHTNGWQMLVWGFCISTVVVYHITFFVNSLAHTVGNRRYKTGDDSRNNFWLAVLTFGEGWHNNHHHFPGSVRQGFRWWEIDLTYYLLVMLSWVGLVWDLKPVPRRIIEEQTAQTPKLAKSTS